MIFKIIFTWSNKQTFGTFLKTLFPGKYVGKDKFGNVLPGGIYIYRINSDSFMDTKKLIFLK